MRPLARCGSWASDDEARLDCGKDPEKWRKRFERQRRKN